MDRRSTARPFSLKVVKASFGLFPNTSCMLLLSKIWELASNGTPKLTSATFQSALRLVSLAQVGDRDRE